MNGHLKNPNYKNITKGALDVRHGITLAPTFGLRRLMLTSAPYEFTL